MGHQIGAVETEELATLMREFPDWGEQHPDIVRELHQPRFHKNRKSKDQMNARIMPRRSTTVPVTEHQATFKVHAPRPRSSKKPPPTPLERHPAPMTFSTNQRSDYIPKDPSVRPQPIVQKENYDRPTGAFEATSTYSKAYMPLEIQPHQSVHPHPSITDGQMKAMNRHKPTFSSNTTNKDTYKRWQTKPALQFTELPTFTGSILYPDPGHSLESTTKTTFTGRQTERVGLIRHSHGHIQLEGDHDMSTTTKSTYQSFDNAPAAEIIVRKPQMPVSRREPFKSKSQSQADYGSCYGAGVPVPTRPVQPHPETIELRFNNKTHFSTEQQSQYAGIDVETHPPPRPIVPEQERQASANVKFEAESRSKSDYKPHDVRQVFVPPVKPMSETRRRENLPKFTSETSNRHFYQPWQVEPRRRYLDFHEGHKYIPPRDKFEGVSTTRTTFIGVPGATAEAYVPVENHALKGEGGIDFNTMYKTTFNANSPLGKLSKEQAARLLRNLKRRKAQEQQFTEHQVMFAQGVGSG